jgi:hypothetical protein
MDVRPGAEIRRVISVLDDWSLPPVDLWVSADDRQAPKPALSRALWAKCPMARQAPPGRDENSSWIETSDQQARRQYRLLPRTTRGRHGIDPLIIAAILAYGAYLTPEKRTAMGHARRRLSTYIIWCARQRRGAQFNGRQNSVEEQMALSPA